VFREIGEMNQRDSAGLQISDLVLIKTNK